MIPSFPLARQQFLASLRAFLADRSIPERDRIEEAIAAVTLVVMAEMLVVMRR